ncbi:MAG TPA: heavy-metal-associated domain-containing protein [Firmicutes bacterium]|nr:heavy-metal-associated domain-containing protein [Candidatus Fermentithermobacillaceae bacterium]
MKTVDLKIKGMGCSHCEKRVADSLRKIGVLESTVSAKTGSARVTFDPAKISVDMLEKAVSDAGYQVIGVSEA